MPRVLRPSIYRARVLRRATTPAEAALWALLRNRGLGYKFRRQHPSGPFIADCFCRAADLVVEVDGPCHRGRRAYDHQRDRWLRAAGLRILRWSNDLVLHQPQRALQRIRRCLPPWPPPLSLWERGRG